MEKLKTEFKNIRLMVKTPILDGAINRVPTESNPKGKNGWYIGWTKFVGGKDIICCSMGDWAQSDKPLFTYKSWQDDNELSAADREAIEKQQAESARKFEAEKIKRHNDTAKKAQQQWLSFSEDGESQYLKNKGVKPYGVRFGNSEKDGDFIVVPVRDYAHDIKSLQFVYDIKPEWLGSNKYFLGGGEKSGHFHLIGEVSPIQPVCFAEGYSTAASVHEATSYPTVTCFDCGNLFAVVEEWRKHYPDHDFIVCADNDQWKPEHGNPGVEKATKVADAFGCALAIPDFPGLNTDSKPTDFNDLHQLAGLEHLKTFLSNIFFGHKSFKTMSTTSTTSTNEDLSDFEKAQKIVEGVIKECKEKPELLGGKEFQDALRLIRAEDAELYNYTYRPQLKENKHNGVILSQIERDTAPPSEGVSADTSIAGELINLVLEECELYFDEHNAEGKCFAVTQDGVEKAFEIGTSSFIEWLSYRYYQTTANPAANIKGKSASEQAVKQACFALAGIAKHDGEKHRFYLRAAPYLNGHVIFMGNDSWQVIEVLPTGWRVLNESPVKFWKPRTMRELPVPVKGGDLSKLWEFANVAEHDRPLVLAWMLESWRQNTPFPVLALTGLQGSAKSSTHDRIRQLADPNAVNLRAAPKTVEDIYTGAGNNWMGSFENISRLTPQQQDSLCTLATGGGFATRKLYTNDEESVIEVKRPVIINSIPNVVTAQDLTDRVVSVELPVITERREESEIIEAFEKAKPEILGGLLDLFVKTLANLSKVKLHNPPRMADFTRLGEAMMQAQGYESGVFTGLFKKNRAESVGKSLEASPIALAILELSENHHKEVFHGAPKKLLELLEPFKSDSDGWVRSPRGLTDVLRRQSPALSQFGISVKISNEKQRTDSGVCYPITIRKNVDVVDVVDIEMKLYAEKNISPSEKVADRGVI